jgi:hypothetical protein
MELGVRRLCQQNMARQKEWQQPLHYDLRMEGANGGDVWIRPKLLTWAMLGCAFLSPTADSRRRFYRGFSTKRRKSVAMRDDKGAVRRVVAAVQDRGGS